MLSIKQKSITFAVNFKSNSFTFRFFYQSN